jgi:hypothetical protein
MYDVGELDCILNEENWDVVADDVPVAFFGVELGGKAANITNGVLMAQHCDQHVVKHITECMLTALPRDP